MFLYRRSAETFKITVWKQERTAQAEIFWSHMRKHLEEATNYLDLASQAGNSNPVIPDDPRPFKFHPTPSTAADGNILAWNVSTTSFEFSPPYAHTSLHVCYFLVKNKKRLELRSSATAKAIAVIDDVESIAFTVSSVIRNSDNEDTIEAGINAGAIGTMFELSLTLAPPKGYIGSELKIPQNHKFRINVAPHPDSAPSY